MLDHATCVSSHQSLCGLTAHQHIEILVEGRDCKSVWFLIPAMYHAHTNWESLQVVAALYFIGEFPGYLLNFGYVRQRAMGKLARSHHGLRLLDLPGREGGAYDRCASSLVGPTGLALVQNRPPASRRSCSDSALSAALQFLQVLLSM